MWFSGRDKAIGLSSTPCCTSNCYLVKKTPSRKQRASCCGLCELLSQSASRQRSRWTENGSVRELGGRMQDIAINCRADCSLYVSPSMPGRLRYELV